MKSERISIFNYEAFYLDHLEGTLGEEDTALLLAFLDDHPELVMEDDDFVVLEPTNDAPVFEDKDSLKMVNDDAAIVLSNAEHFLVAESEGQLTDSKQKELNAFVAQHPHLEQERRYLAAMFLKADTSIVYVNKVGLKRKGAVIFWPYIALAAASILIAFLFVMNNGSDTEMVADKDPIENKENVKEETPIQEPKDLQFADEGEGTPSNSEDDQQTTNVSPDQPLNSQRNFAPERSPMASVNTLKRQQVRRVLNTMDDQELRPVATYIVPPVVTLTAEDDLAQVSSPEMKNPIKPITSRLGKTLKTNVDFQTGKAANNEGAGFSLKIGKFEISRKKGNKKKN